MLVVMVGRNFEKMVVEYYICSMGNVDFNSGPDSIEHGFGFLGIKIPSANRRFLESKNGARKSHADLGHISLPGNHPITPIQKMS